MAETINITTARQRELIATLTDLATRRDRERSAAEAAHSAALAAAQRKYEQDRDWSTQQFERDHGQLILQYKEAREKSLCGYESAGYVVAQEEERFQEVHSQKLADNLEIAKTVFQHRIDQIKTSAKESEALPKVELARFKQQIDEQLAQSQRLLLEAQAVTKRRGAELPPLTTPPTPPTKAGKAKLLEYAATGMQIAARKLYDLQHQPAAKFVEDGWPVLIFIFGVMLSVYPFYLLLRSQGWLAVAAVSLLAPLIIAVCVRQIMRPIARRHTLRIAGELQQAVAEARAAWALALRSAKTEAEAEVKRIVQRREDDLAAASASYEQTREQETAQHHARIAAAQNNFFTRRKTLEDTQEAEQRRVAAEYPPRIERIETEFEAKLLALREDYCRMRQQSVEQHAEQATTVERQWQQRLVDSQASIAAMNEYCHQHFAPWEQLGSQQPQPSANQTTSEAASGFAALPFGAYHFDFGPQGAESNQALDNNEQSPQRFTLPAVMAYPESPSLLLEASGEGREVASATLRNVMLRLLTSLPPGKVRFTIIDPVGLGQNFSAFMHLADFDERLVTNRIWTEAPHILQRLADLTEHMENVIQKYLRNEYASIQEYNEQAGEVAEPYHILVIANFPANFSEEAARRLASIASSGARCGVYTLISVDNKFKLPPNFDLADLEAQAATLVWNEEAKQFRWKHDDLQHLPLTLETPPADERFTQLVSSVGSLAKDASRVEVPFDASLPPREAWWTSDSRSEVVTPLGRSGAKKFQPMRLGKGTSQHVLIAGKTGSGKSTLLHTMITSMAIHYSPHELHFYLIDFKKGVEFKAYAACKLPHARVIAIESEREFGMSVLERLDQELKRRGDLFRKHGVQDVRGYRDANPTAIMPRVLLMIDEFQEFFTTDDKIAHGASLLLDRLVRQGRAFGIHVLLGSQTLAGAYSLARSTLGQMAVRIALQCSESDAHLILSEDNTAARLLNRPGEAIYNDANGMFEGNHPFQVFWLSDHDREAHLNRLAEMAVERGMELEPQTIFEGNEAADPRDNHLLQAVLRAPTRPEKCLAPTAWLGAAVAIKDPTSVTFRRQSGSNVLVVGQREELALGMLATGVVGLAAQMAHEPSGGELSTFNVLDGTRPESPDAGFWQRLSDTLHLQATIASPRNAAAVIGRLVDEVDRRLTAGNHGAEPLFVVIHDIARFRDLRKSDDFSFSSDDEAPNTGKQLATVLREGPAVGVHTLVWADSFNNASRALDRQTLRDFELRVLFQMSAADSSNLMDSPAASKLGPHLALFYSEEQGQAEKFRPYSPPTSDWLAGVAEQFAATTQSKT